MEAPRISRLRFDHISHRWTNRERIRRGLNRERTVFVGWPNQRVSEKLQRIDTNNALLSMEHGTRHCNLNDLSNALFPGSTDGFQH